MAKIKDFLVKNSQHITVIRNWSWIISLVAEGILFMMEWAYKNQIWISILAVNVFFAFFIVKDFFNNRFKRIPIGTPTLKGEQENTMPPGLKLERPEKIIEKQDHFITLEEAAILFHEKHPLSDQLLAYVVPMEKRSAIDEAIEELNGENNNNWKEHHWRTTNILHILSRFFANGLLKLYGEHYPSKKLQVVPIKEIKNWGDDFVSLFSDYDRKYVNYTNLSCELNEFLNFVSSKKDCLLAEGQIKRFAGV